MLTQARWCHVLLAVTLVGWWCTWTYGGTMQEEFSGVRMVAEELSGWLSVPGPLPHTTGWQPTGEGAAPVALAMETDTAARGSFSLWIRTDQRYHGRVDSRIETYREFLVDGCIRLEIISYDDMLRLAFSGRGPALNFMLPSLPGPGWYHLAYVWDAAKGERQIYLNGTPVVPATTVPEWDAAPVNELRLNPGRFAVSGVRLQAEPLTTQALRRIVTATYWGSVDYLLAARAPGPYVIEEQKGRLIHENPLARETDAADWVMEGPGVTSFEDGWMRLYSSRAGQGGHFVYWCPVTTPEDYVVEWDFQVIHPHLAIIFFSATAPDGLSLFDPSLRSREGVFTRYLRGDIDAYHISFFAGHRPVVNMRKNHGFFLTALGRHAIPPDSTDVHRVQLMKNGGHIQLAVDGEVAIDFFDDGRTYGPGFGGGLIAFRQMQYMDARYRNLRIYEVDAAYRPAPSDRPPVGRMPRPEDQPPASVNERLGGPVQSVGHHPVPADGWRFLLDPQRAGEDDGWYHPDFNDDDWGEIRTGIPWQEAGHDYVGAAWYRRRIEVPAVPDPAAAAAVLEFQGVDESAWVWVNGHYVGAHDLGSAGWDRPFQLDISEQVQWGAPNQLTIKAMNTAGLGGIYEPIVLRIYHAASP